MLIAVLLMPFGMEPACAAGNDDATMAGMTVTMEHRPDQSSKDHLNDGVATCSMACASALPAQDFVRAEPMRRRSQLVVRLVSPVLFGLHPETVTPPPKFD